ncbi:hypothetical protein [Rhodospirillum rubrum]|uniref:Uncharacterized protein n=1 Tax=Rhodospirillum rubrum (strain ATCC 11170 / ATH 1.1.1 / DSM 467 / LMG 4362 / NCIMB 8255 / S1) TaxID=269796 RepID=Q2RR56_RHORT|nr:hypothetical protein [Rhodospirillum rubrum]ABC23389.1 hypothetical protein Rru_A2592 [Rhodospirillum rubrum ATCC 11170]AEO49125.1 hypothetical protein F11_13315 [Rhodospirillum rubrum F11]MBK5955039.1 hypothetical protein [Rhodospirillum rubrum]QXG79362.1 hypothetical protein KUL73_13370 [Rhodospirillum rubrum]HCF18968.1 hypothetical protein [Rhodospirillum rubrum]
MILTPIPLAELPGLSDAFAQALADHPLALAVFARIAATTAFVRGDTIALSTDSDHHAAALALVRSFGMGVIDGPPAKGFTWDGQAVAADMEPSVLIHEIGHFQACAPERRHVIDFGLGAGPETGLRGEAEAVASLGGVAGDLEEAFASLLGILWEAEVGQPAILAFLEQNWLAGGATAANRAHFLKIVEALAAHGFLSPEGRPTRALREVDDQTFLGPLLVAPPQGAPKAC